MTEHDPQHATATATALPLLLATDRAEDHDGEPWEIRVSVEARLELTGDLSGVIRVDPGMIGVVARHADDGPLVPGSGDEVTALLPRAVAQALWGALGRALNQADDLAIGEAQAVEAVDET